MKIMLVTDIEGVAGVLNFEEYCSPGTPYYEKAKRLLTEEVNAVIRGMFDGGADEIRVVDGHGPGAIDPELLDSRVELMRGLASPVWPFTLDSSFDGVGWVGQHAKSRTPYSHLTHTGTFGVWEITANGLPVGEFGEFALCAGELGVPVIFAGGENAFANAIRLSGVLILPEGLKTIEDGAFLGCGWLEEVYIPATVETIGEYAFNYCEILSSVSFAQVKEIGAYAFDSCIAVTTVNFTGDDASKIVIGEYNDVITEALGLDVE